jgi:hypothetical protein
LPFTEATYPINTSDARSQINDDITELNAESAREKISGNQIIGTGAITDTNIADKVVIKNRVQIKKESEVTPIKILSVQLKPDEARMALPEKEIIIKEELKYRNSKK